MPLTLLLQTRFPVAADVPVTEVWFSSMKSTACVPAVLAVFQPWPLKCTLGLYCAVVDVAAVVLLNTTPSVDVVPIAVCKSVIVPDRVGLLTKVGSPVTPLPTRTVFAAPGPAAATAAVPSPTITACAVNDVSLVPPCDTCTVPVIEPVPMLGVTHDVTPVPSVCNT